MKMLWTAAALLLLAGCNGSDNDSAFVTKTDAVTPAQLTAAIAAATHAQAATLAQVQAQQTVDESELKRVALFGHIPGTAATLRAISGSARVASAIVDTTDYGICPDMGMHVGAGIPDVGVPTDVFKQCTGNKYAVNSETGAIARAPVIWFPLPNCDGTPIEFEADGAYDRPTLQGGFVFRSPKDGAVLWVQPLGSGDVAQQLTSQSVYTTGGPCINATETHIGYSAVPNATDGLTGSGAPDGGVPNTYVYN
jgi:hypothetical protein